MEVFVHWQKGSGNGYRRPPTRERRNGRMEPQASRPQAEKSEAFCGVYKKSILALIVTTPM